MFEIAGKEANETSLPWQACFIHVGSCKGMLSACSLQCGFTLQSSIVLETFHLTSACVFGGLCLPVNVVDNMVSSDPS